MEILGKQGVNGLPARSHNDGFGAGVFDLAVVPHRGFFLIAGGVGLIRFPDFYTRMHAAGMTDTLGAGLLLIGMVLQSGDVLTAIKLIMIGFFIFFTGPTATYAIAHAAFMA